MSRLTLANLLPVVVWMNNIPETIIKEYYQTENRCYKAGKRITPTGIVVHSTGANNPNLKRYVGPDDGILGKNKNGNHWNKESATKCMHAFIGKVEDGSIRVYQTLPWDYRCWGAGKGPNGSYNDSHIQFEICEDAKTNEAYYREAFTHAARLCAYLCRRFGIKVENVVGHYEAHAAGYASNHGDPRSWQKNFGDTMDDFRAQVAALLDEDPLAIPDGAGKPEENTAQEPQKPAQEPAKAQGGVNMPTLREGDQGTAVRILQRMLIMRGCKLPRYGCDGHYGEETKAAVEAYQTTHALTIDGICGPLTWAALAG